MNLKWCLTHSKHLINHRHCHFELHRIPDIIAGYVHSVTESLSYLSPSSSPFLRQKILPKLKTLEVLANLIWQMTNSRKFGSSLEPSEFFSFWCRSLVFPPYCSVVSCLLKSTLSSSFLICKVETLHTSTQWVVMRIKWDGKYGSYL